MHKKIIESLKHCWKTWSTQAMELQLLRADQENKKKEGQGFYKMDEGSVTVIQDELSDDFHELTTRHTAEITKMLEEYDGNQLQLALELESYEKECL